MKIALVVHTSYPDHIGGREHHVHFLAQTLGKEHEVYVLTCGTNINYSETKMTNYTLIRHPMWAITVSRNPLQIYRLSLSIKKTLKRISPAIIHAFEYGSSSTYQAFAYARKKGTPFFITVYGYQFNNPVLTFLKKVYDTVFGRKIFNYANMVLCPSIIQQNELLHCFGKLVHGISDKVLIQTNSIQTSNFENLLPDPTLKQTYAPNNELILSSITRILPRKGLQTLINVIKRLHEDTDLPPFVFLVIGPDCGQKNELARQVDRLGLNKCVHFIKSVPYDKIHSYISISDIVILTSHYEGFPLSILEAMAAGKSVVFSNIPCAARIIRDGHNGLLVDPSSNDSIFHQLKRLIQDPALRATIGTQAKEDTDDFDIGNETHKLVEYYTKAKIGNAEHN